MHPAIRYQAGNEHSADSPFGRTDLTVAPDGNARLDYYLTWMHRAWVATVEPAVVERLHAALASSTFPEPLPHDKPVPAGSDTRVLGTETADGTRAGVSVPWHDADGLPGYKEAFEILDTLLVLMCEDFRGSRQPLELEIGDLRLVLRREGHDVHVWRHRSLYRLPGLTITGLDRVTYNGQPLPTTLVFNGEYELIFEEGELTWHEGPPAPDFMPAAADAIGLEGVGVELPFTVRAVSETWAGQPPYRFLAGVELHGEPRPRKAFRRRSAPPTVLILTDAGGCELVTREEFDERLHRLDTETTRYDAPI